MDAHEKQIFGGESIMDFYQHLFKGGIIISTFGASITFQVIIQQLDDTQKTESGNHPFDYNEAQSFLATAWLLFIVGLGLSCYSLGILWFYRLHMKLAINDGGTHPSEIFAIIAALLVQGLMLAAFLFSGLAISAYSRKPGLVAVGFILGFSIIALILWIVQVK